MLKELKKNPTYYHGWKKVGISEETTGRLQSLIEKKIWAHSVNKNYVSKYTGTIIS